MDSNPSLDALDPFPRTLPHADRVYFVPFRWLKEAQDLSICDMEKDGGILYTASSSSYGGPMKIINNIFNSDLVFNLHREVDSEQADSSEVGISGRDFALILDDTWLQALKWHSDSNAAMRSGGNFSVAKDTMSDVYPLQLRLIVMPGANQLTLKISKKDNAIEFYRRACKIFSADSEPVRIWDFSGKTNLYFMNDKDKSTKYCLRHSDQEVLLELQVYGLSNSIKCRTESKKDDLALQQSKVTPSSCCGSLIGNDVAGNMDSNSIFPNFSAINGSAGVGPLGLTGLQNLGNTCFMNSALQCLAHTPKLVEYFLGDYTREINQHSPLGMDGELALAFGELLRKLWAPGKTPVAPRAFKAKLAHFAPQFNGFNQHDSQELLAFLLAGLHEDLNHVICKPYFEAKDSDDRPDEEVANEYWENHLARNDSIIVDVCQGQFKSTLVCPICSKVSVTFDPFMYLSLPLPSTTMRMMTLMVFSTYDGSQPSPYTITVPKSGKCKDMIDALGAACHLGADESLLVAEVYSNRIIRFLEEPSDLLSLIRNEDRLVAYRLPNEAADAPLVVFMHQRMEERFFDGNMTSSWKAFGVPLLTRLHNVNSGSDVQNLFLTLMKPFFRPRGTVLNVRNTKNAANGGDALMDDCGSPSISVGESLADKSREVSEIKIELEFYQTDEKGITMVSKLEMNEPVSVTGGRLYVYACWSDETIELYDMLRLLTLPEVFKPGFTKKPQESISLYNCLEAFLKEEPLGPDDMWYCPSCKKHQQASKKLDLWRLPEILVIHLKRFSYSRFMKNKLETYVEFPIHDLDLSSYIASKNSQLSHCYELYAVSNHYGGMGGGHYTAYVHHQWEYCWYDFDDSHVAPISEDNIRTSAAYVLFYRRIGTDN